MTDPMERLADLEARLRVLDARWRRVSVALILTAVVLAVVLAAVVLTV